MRYAYNLYMKTSVPYIVSAHSSLSDSLQQEVQALEKLCFLDHFIQTAKQSSEENDKFCSDADSVHHILTTENGKVIGGTRVFKRVIRFENEKIMLGGVGSVATHPAKRNKKVATAMLTKAMELLQEEKCDVAYLCADIYTEKALLFYEQFGFTLLPKPHTYLGKSGKRYTDNDGMIAPITSKKIFQQILASPTSLNIGIGNW